MGRVSKAVACIVRKGRVDHCDIEFRGVVDDQDAIAVARGRESLDGAIDDRQTASIGEDNAVRADARTFDREPA